MGQFVAKLRRPDLGLQTGGLGDAAALQGDGERGNQRQLRDADGGEDDRPGSDTPPTASAALKRMSVPGGSLDSSIPHLWIWRQSTMVETGISSPCAAACGAAPARIRFTSVAATWPAALHVCIVPPTSP